MEACLYVGVLGMAGCIQYYVCVAMNVCVQCLFVCGMFGSVCCEEVGLWYSLHACVCHTYVPEIIFPVYVHRLHITVTGRGCWTADVMYSVLPLTEALKKADTELQKAVCTSGTARVQNYSVRLFQMT